MSERGLVKIPVLWRLENEKKKKEVVKIYKAGLWKVCVKMALFSDPDTQNTIESELDIVKKTLSEKIEGTEIISCHPVAVNVRIT